MVEECFKGIVCNLSAGIQAALSDTLEATKAVLTAELARLSAQLVVVNLATVPLNAVKAVAEEVVNTTLSYFEMLPLALIEGCEPAGRVNVIIREAAAREFAKATAVVDDLNRKWAFIAEIEAAQAEIQELIDEINEFEVALGECNG